MFVVNLVDAKRVMDIKYIHYLISVESRLRRSIVLFSNFEHAENLLNSKQKLDNEHSNLPGLFIPIESGLFSLHIPLNGKH